MHGDGSSPLGAIALGHKCGTIFMSDLCNLWQEMDKSAGRRYLARFLSAALSQSREWFAQKPGKMASQEVVWD